jgi:hypothetical protein
VSSSRSVQKNISESVTVPGANVSFVDLRDEKEGEEKKEVQENATPTQLAAGE